jgi:hypothetical protein
MKICTKCKVEKEISEFPLSKTCVLGYRSYCKECKNKQTSSYYYNNKEHHRCLSDSWAKDNIDRIREIKSNWKKRNANWVAADNARRYATQLTATLKDTQELTDFVYEEAHALRKLRNNLFSFDWHVDHIIPLRGKLVSGLHVWNNFAVIPALDNYRKNNNYAISEERCPPI